MAGKLELKKSASGKFMFNLKAGNNQVILTSQLYGDKTAAKNGMASVMKNASKDANFERKKSTKGQPYFVLKSPNGQTIGKSEMYSSTSAMEKGIRSVKTNARKAAVKDTTK